MVSKGPGYDPRQPSSEVIPDEQDVREISPEVGPEEVAQETVTLEPTVPPKRTKWGIKRVLAHLVMIVFLVLIVFPLYWMLITSVKPGGEVLGPPATFWPREFTLANYAEAFRLDVFPGIVNSFVAALISTALAVAIGTLAAYGLERYRFRGRNDTAFFILSQRMMPPIAVAIPFFLLFLQLRLTDTIVALIIAYLVFNLPIAVWLMRPFVRDVPVEMEQAALVDGYTPLRVFRKITLPLLKAGIATTSIFVFIFAWNEFLFALILTRTNALTLPVALASLGGNPYGIEWARIMAVSVIAVVPVLVLYAFILRFLVKGMKFGGVKG
jgi:multiple sugar transport system permease protein